MQISKWGNSLAVRLPKAVVDELKLKEGDSIEIDFTDKKNWKVARDTTREKALEALRKHRGTLPPGFKFNRDEANER